MCDQLAPRRTRGSGIRTLPVLPMLPVMFKTESGNCGSRLGMDPPVACLVEHRDQHIRPQDIQLDLTEKQRSQHPVSAGRSEGPTGLQQPVTRMRRTITRPHSPIKLNTSGQARRSTAAPSSGPTQHPHKSSGPHHPHRGPTTARCTQTRHHPQHHARNRHNKGS